MNTEYQVIALGEADDVLPIPNLGNKQLEEGIQELLLAFNEGGTKYLILWIGSNRIPRTKVGDHLIGWTQHGVVYNNNGQMIGSYERLQDNEGPEKNENAMLIVLWS